MYKSHRGTQSECESDLVESTVQPNLVDINDNVKKAENSPDDHCLAFKPSLKPLKWSKIKNKMVQRQLDTPQFEMPQKKIIYVKTFNHVKNEQIINMYENNLAKLMSNTANDAKNVKNWPNNRNKKKLNFDSQVNLDFFKANKEKFNPLKVNKPKKVPKPKPEDDNSAINEFAFLTGVNIMGAENNQDDEEEEPEQELEVPTDIHFENKKDESANQELLDLVEEQRAERLGKTAKRNLMESTNLPSIKRPVINNDQVAMSISEARYKNHINQKPKMYISWKTNSVQPFGRPETYQDHLLRVFNKEGTPAAHHPLPSYFGPKKDIKKVMLDTYLSQFNLEALKEMDEDLYELAKEKRQKDKEKMILAS